MAEAISTESDRQTVVFTLDHELYGIDIFRVNEIIRMRDITPVPNSRSHLRGLINLRGKTIPVIDLKARLHLAATEETDKSRIIVIENESGAFGVIVDGVREVLSISGSQIDPNPAIAANVTGSFVLGVAKNGDSLITLLDLEEALAA